MRQRIRWNNEIAHFQAWNRFARGGTGAFEDLWEMPSSCSGLQFDEDEASPVPPAFHYRGAVALERGTRLGKTPPTHAAVDTASSGEQKRVRVKFRLARELTARGYIVIALFHCIAKTVCPSVPPYNCIPRRQRETFFQKALQISLIKKMAH